ncbi:MAG: hypothetical protein GXP25_17275 [Planctomycetes bacterium]|nr:hypothetical protein [Planctomycetota bacterium]
MTRNITNFLDDQPSVRGERWRCRAAAGWLGLLVVLSIPWWIDPTFFIADDSYFYLQTAKNIALTGKQTFNGLFPTNGLHPLWLYLLSLYSWLVSLLSPGLLSHPAFAIPLSAALLALGAVNFWKVARILRVNAWLLVSIPLMYLWLFRVLYSEGHLFYFCLSLLTRVTLDGTRESTRGHLLIGLLCAFVFLSRLDSLFFVAAYFVWYFVTEGDRRRVVVSALVCGLTVLPYLLSNLIWFGGLTPISGWMKSSFPSICWTWRYHHKGPLCIELLGYQAVFGIAPILFAILTVVAFRRRFVAKDSLIYVFLGGSILHFAYVALFARSHTFWHWYYVLPMTLGAMCVALFVREVPFLRSLSLPPVLAAILLVLASFINDRIKEENYQGWLSKVNYCRKHDIHNQVILTCDWPGGFAYFTDNRIIAADMLTSNRRFFDAMRKSPNALQYILDYCRRIGKPIGYIFSICDPWLVGRNRYRTIVYYDPKKIPVKQVIGEIEVGDPIHKADFVVWKLSK